MRTSVFLAVPVACIALSSAASAQEQPWLSDRRYGEGIGIRAGNLELHPGVAAEAGYDSNYFQRAASENIIPMARLRLTPSFSVATLGEQRRESDGAQAAQPDVDFRATASASYSEFIATSGGAADREEARDQRHLAGELGLRAEFAPGRPWGADILGDFRRIAQPSNSPNELFSFDRDVVRLGAGAIWRPGGGVFDWRLGYEFRYNYFEEQAYRSLVNVHHYVKTRGRWRFLPRSALLYEAELGYIHYTNADNQTLNDSQPVRSRVGFNGLITNHFALLALAGWGASFYRPMNAPVEDFDSVIAQTEFKWFILPQPKLPEEGAKVGLSSVAVGYVRDFSNSYLTDYYQRDRGYLNFAYFIGGVFLFNAEGGWSHITFPQSYYPAGGGLRKIGFTEERFDAQVFGEYRFSDQFGVNATVRYNTALDKAAGPDDNVIPTDTTGTGGDDLAFSRAEAFLGLRWFL